MKWPWSDNASPPPKIIHLDPCTDPAGRIGMSMKDERMMSGWVNEERVARDGDIVICDGRAFQVSNVERKWEPDVEMPYFFADVEELEVVP